MPVLTVFVNYWIQYYGNGVTFLFTRHKLHWARLGRIAQAIQPAPTASPNVTTIGCKQLRKPYLNSFRLARSDPTRHQHFYKDVVNFAIMEFNEFSRDVLPQATHTNTDHAQHYLASTVKVGERQPNSNGVLWPEPLPQNWITILFYANTMYINFIIN